MKTNVKRPEEYKQVCVWEGTVLGDGSVDDLVNFMKEVLKTRIFFLEEIKTNPDKMSGGSPKEGTGGRNDLFFAVHEEDIGVFAVPRLKYEIRWLEDVLNNESHFSIYPERVIDYRTW